MADSEAAMAENVVPAEGPQSRAAEVRRYWDTHIHDIGMSANPVGSPAFFRDLELYHYEKLSYLPELVSFPAYRNRRVLEIGCGLGIDLARFAAAGAVVTGIDLSPVSVELAAKHFSQRGLRADFRVMDGEALAFPDGSFDVVYAHGVLQYTPDPVRMVGEMLRVLENGGEAIVTVYNRYSWLNFLRCLMNVKLEHEGAPVFRKYSRGEFRRLLRDFSHVRLFVERFPVKTKLQRGAKAWLYNELFVGLFNSIPRTLVRPFGWHLIAKAVK
ncbi:MAG TPA: class I SAM-dependent methyltransferase [Candidatus Eisenbacteria bacterium]|nr:class I SAM-dependent methyltransferase [Candidatus Eisenbacteria bacterium]